MKLYEKVKFYASALEAPDFALCTEDGEEFITEDSTEDSIGCIVPDGFIREEAAK